MQIKVYERKAWTRNPLASVTVTVVEISGQIHAIVVVDFSQPIPSTKALDISEFKKSFKWHRFGL